VDEEGPLTGILEQYWYSVSTKELSQSAISFLFLEESTMGCGKLPLKPLGKDLGIIYCLLVELDHGHPMGFLNQVVYTIT
jgi:hypothetical protein